MQIDILPSIYIHTCIHTIEHNTENKVIIHKHLCFPGKDFHFSVKKKKPTKTNLTTSGLTLLPVGPNI